MLQLMELILISGLSGSGKSVALHLLEDAGYYCVDNLPVVMLTVLVRMLKEEGISKVAVAIDARSGHGIELLPDKLALLEKEQTQSDLPVSALQLETLLKRYSESRRRHPLASPGKRWKKRSAPNAPCWNPISTLGHRIDTSGLKANALREWVRQFIESEPGQGLTLMFESFGFKHGIPLDADFVFDVRCLPNPHYDPDLRLQTGKDQPVIVLPRSRGRSLPDARRHRPLCRHLAALLHPRQPQLPDGRHRLHRRPAPLGLYRRMAGQRIPQRRPACWCGTAHSPAGEDALAGADPAGRLADHGRQALCWSASASRLFWQGGLADRAIIRQNGTGLCRGRSAQQTQFAVPGPLGHHTDRRRARPRPRRQPTPDRANIASPGLADAPRRNRHLRPQSRQRADRRADQEFMTQSVIELTVTDEDRRIAWLATAAVALSLVDAAIPSPLARRQAGAGQYRHAGCSGPLRLGHRRLGQRLRVLAGSLLLGYFLAPGFFLSLSRHTLSLLTLGLARHLPGAGSARSA
jgi:UPF0042 nucleotide-binding protein